MKADSGTDIRTLRVDGGASANDFLMQFQADILGIPVNRPSCTESTALGAAFLAGLTSGFWKSRQELLDLIRADRVFIPVMDNKTRNEKIAGWNKAVRYARGWADSSYPGP